ncbi:UBX domain protein (Ubx5), putative [Talaromyces stipitatus ATCC 10500]|uniref:UBX domain protein (Ubx5), putative n=1 Tax=Talaromyces stipitatus (strain ATCC 10500 / CBS 375.48 / QM 6759 / NRRL 1006) TaxID=441959 RepID=B8LZE9_TALSN|nr:UBX domain protein (Ubx5), putative [Talaromyces stipitatus ATCC 10500]EED21702.1 UBX domain protein (Ubx5), putative [Talaromyces stipitatus ATCC 10500]
MEGDVVAQFQEVTGSTEELANQYLDIADFDIQQAMQLYFENGGAPLGPTQQPASAAASRPSNAINIDSEDDDLTIDESRSSAPTRQPAESTFEDDAAMARRLQEELYAGGDSGDNVRAPIARTTETLVGPGADGYGDYDPLSHFRMRQGGRNTRPGIFNQRDTSIWDESSENGAPSQRSALARATGGASETSSKSTLLAEMYRPPFELMSRLPWDAAREEGRENEKWLLINIQDPSIFDCQVLNRDLWKDPGVRDTVKENFIFLQYNKDDERGLPYLQYYFQGSDVSDNYPHIAIVDPRTGEQVKVWSGAPVIKAPDFLMQLHEFLDRYSLKQNARNPVAKRKPDVPREKKLESMTEEEMLEMALKNSLEGNAAAEKLADPDELTRSTGDLKGKGRADEDISMAEEEEEEEEEAAAEPEDPNVSVFRSIPSDRVHTEPPADPTTTTRIQFRHPSGRVIRRFSLSDPVRRIYEWLKSEPPLEEKAGVVFELNAMGKNLIDELDTTVQDAGLKNGTVMIGYLED